MDLCGGQAIGGTGALTISMLCDTQPDGQHMTGAQYRDAQYGCGVLVSCRQYQLIRNMWRDGVAVL